MTKSNILLLVCAISSIVKTSNAQLRIDTSLSAEYIVKIIFANKESFRIENVEYRSDKKSIGIFHCPMKYNKMISDGIILSTGDVFDAIGPNDSPNKSSKSLINSDNELSAIAKGNTFDTAILEFDFIPFNDSICFNFFFASEEYPEYVKKNVNDVFGFFLNSEELNTKKNLALLEEDNTPITVDNINATTNNKYFIENYSWENGNTQNWRNNKQISELALTFQFDGLTTLLHAGAKVIPNKKYHIKLAISDVGDRLFDSAVFLEAGSFKSISTDGHLLFKQLVKEEFGETIITDLKNSISVNLNINFDADSFKVSGKESFVLLDKVFHLLNKDSTIRIEINGHTDDSGTKEYNKVLSLNRAKNVANYLVSKGIEADRVTFKGYGDSKPISFSDKTINRRVEFVFTKNISGN